MNRNRQAPCRALRASGPARRAGAWCRRARASSTSAPPGRRRWSARARWPVRGPDTNSPVDCCVFGLGEEGRGVLLYQRPPASACSRSPRCCWLRQASRLDEFLAACGVHPTTRVTILTDGAGEFDKAAKGCTQPICHILDWFHIAMKFKTAERSVFGCQQIDPSEREAFESEIHRIKWLVWHGKASKAVARLKKLEVVLCARPQHEGSTLWWNLHKATCYIQDNPGLVNYARRHHKGLPVSSSIAEAAVNQVVSLRMAKKRQMRWSDEGAHLLAQVRVHEINGELRPRAVPTPLRPTKPAHDPQWDAYLMREAA